MVVAKRLRTWTRDDTRGLETSSLALPWIRQRLWTLAPPECAASARRVLLVDRDAARFDLVLDGVGQQICETTIGQVVEVKIVRSQ